MISWPNRNLSPNVLSKITIQPFIREEERNGRAFNCSCHSMFIRRPDYKQWIFNLWKLQMELSVSRFGFVAHSAFSQSCVVALLRLVFGCCKLRTRSRRQWWWWFSLAWRMLCTSILAGFFSGKTKYIISINSEGETLKDSERMIDNWMQCPVLYYYDAVLYTASTWLV